MNDERARTILSAYRGPDDDADPIFARALEHCRSNPELMAWWIESRQLDDWSRSELANIKIPALKDRLLRIGEETQPRKIIPFPKQPALFAVAALVALCLGLLVFWTGTANRNRNAGVEPADLQAFVVDLLGRDGVVLAATNIPMETIRTWLRKSDAPCRFVLPGKLPADGALGCQKYQLPSGPVSLVCFRVENGAIIHMFIASRRKSTDPNEPARIKSINGMGMATWTDERHLYLLADPRGTEFLKGRFST
jgi:hypothetical protein